MSPLWLAAWMAVAEAEERRFAVVFGTNRGDADDEPLRYADQDVRRVGDVLVELGGVAPEDLVRLEGATADDVRGVLRRLGERMAASTADRTLLLVYYSGHADALALHLSGTRLPLDELKRLVSSAPADARVLVLDACRTGELTRTRGATQAQPFEIVVSDELAASGLAILTSAAAGEDAQESDRLQGGVFTHHLVSGMRGAADASGDARVTLSEAYQYTYAQTLLTTSDAPMLQHPSFAFDLTGRDDLILTRLDSDSHAGRLRLALEGEYLIFDASGRDLVAELQAEAGTSIVLDAAPYLVRWRTPEHVFEADVEVPDGGLTEVGPEHLRLLPLGQAARRGGEDWHRPALSLVVGGGVMGPVREGLGVMPVARAGLRLDTSFLTFQLGARYGRDGAENGQLTITEDLAGAELGLVRMADVGPISLGAGIVAGVDGVFQRFETPGVAPPRSALTGRLGAVGRFEGAVHPRVSIGVQGGVDAMWSPGEDEVHTEVVPHVALDVGLWVF